MTTKGQVAELMKGVDAVEYKAIIRDHQIKPAMQRYGLKLEGNKRQIYFFDTPDLKLFKAGVIWRARRVIGGIHDCTVKFRPVNPGAIPAKWKRMEGFKIEADANEDFNPKTQDVVKSASLTLPVEKGLIKRIEAGKEPIARLFSPLHHRFLVALAEHDVKLDHVVMMGPMPAWRWTFRDKGLPWKMTAEVWRREDGDEICEVSIKVPVEQAAAAKAGFMAFLAEVGVERDEGQTAKTHWFLDYYSQKRKSPKDKNEKSEEAK